MRHRKGGVHPSGWNPDRKLWKDEQDKFGRTITPETAKAQLDTMMHDPKSSEALKDSKPATRSYPEQTKHNEAVRKAKKAADDAKEAADKATKKG